MNSGKGHRSSEIRILSSEVKKKKKRDEAIKDKERRNIATVVSTVLQFQILREAAIRNMIFLSSDMASSKLMNPNFLICVQHFPKNALFEV